MDLLNQLTALWKKPGSPVAMPTVPQPPTALEQRQRLLTHHVRLVTRGMSNGLCAYGSKGGLGKTRVILETLRKERVRPLLLNGHITPLSLFTNLYGHPDAVVFLDDCDALFRNLPALGILRSALWGDDGKHLVTYNSSQLKTPSSFYFTGRIIFAVNVIPKHNHAFAAVLSRVDQYELDASNEEVLEMMRRLAAKGFDGLTPDECMAVVDFIAEFSATRELSLRLLEPSLRKVIYAKDANIDWKELVASQLHEIGQTAAPTPMLMMNARTYDIECMKQVLLDFPNNVAEQEKVWRMLTKRSRATFFRLKKALAEQAANDAQATAMTDSVVCGACAATGIPGSSSDLELTSNAQDTSNDVAPV